MIHTSQLTLQANQLPAAYNAFITQLDNALSQPWAIGELQRQFTIQSRDIPGGTFTSGIDANVRKLMRDYEMRGGWYVRRIESTDDAWTFIFSRVPFQD